MRLGPDLSRAGALSWRFASMSYCVGGGRGFRHAQEMGERVFLVAAIAIGIIVPMVGVLYATWVLMH